MALYDAFISYSHAKDKPIAASLQSVIQRLGKPWYRRRALRVFRDDTSLSATPSLWPSIEQALGNSRFLVLLASPEAASSPWVNKEVSYWLDHKSADTLLIALTDGDLAWDNGIGDFVWREHMPLPPVLTGRFTTEPKWVDLRTYRDGADARDARFIEAGADFAAAIHGMPKEDLLSQELRQQRRALTLSWSAAGSLMVLAGLAGWQWREAVAQRDRAEQTLAQATETANALVHDLAEKFRDSGLPISIVRDVLDSARALQEQLAGSGQVTTALRQSEGDALMATVRTLLTVGDTDGALSAAERARRIFEGLAAGGGDKGEDWQRNLAVAYGRIGDVLVARGDLADAIKSYRAAAGMLERLVAADRTAFGWQADLATAYGRIGGVLKQQGKLDEALEVYRQISSTRKRLADADRGNTAWQHLAVAHAGIGDVLGELAVLLNRRGDAKGMQDKLAEALASYRESVTIMTRLAAADRNNTAWQRDLAVAHAKVSDVLGAQGKLEEGLASYRENITIMERLAASDRGNAQWQDDLATSYGHLGDLLKEQGRFGRPGMSLSEMAEVPRKLAEALEKYQAGLAILQQLAAADRRNASRQEEVAAAHRKIGDVLAAQRKLTDALASYRASLDIRRQIAAADPGNPERQRELAAIAGRIGNLAFGLLLAKDFARALQAADQAIAVAPGELWLQAGRAHALMLVGRTDEARALYLQHRGKPRAHSDRSWDAVVLEGFGELRKGGLARPLMEEIEPKFAARGSPF